MRENCIENYRHVLLLLFIFKALNKTILNASEAFAVCFVHLLSHSQIIKLGARGSEPRVRVNV